MSSRFPTPGPKYGMLPVGELRHVAEMYRMSTVAEREAKFDELVALFTAATNEKLAGGGDAELREKLAAIEHERWADWQKYMHGRLKHIITEIHGDKVEGMLMSPKDYQHWEEQIAAEYAELSKAEQAIDMEQVDRYWPLIQGAINTAKQTAVASERTRLIGLLPEPDMKGKADQSARYYEQVGYNRAIAEMRNVLEGK